MGLAEDFPSTHWSNVAQAARGSSSTRRAALDQLIRRYQPALEKHLGHRFRLGREDAREVVQGFIADKVLERNLPAHADRDRGRFRNLLLTALDNYARDRLRERGHEALADDSRSGPAAKAPAAADLFDREWGREVLRRALCELQAVCRESGSEHVYKVFEKRVLEPTLGEGEPVPYATLVSELGLRDAHQAANALVTAKRRFRGCLRAIVAEYEPAAPEAEMTELRRVFEGAA